MATVQIPIPTISLRDQRRWMKTIHPAFQCSIKRIGRRQSLICRGCLSPMPISEEYTVRIEYKIGDIPRVWIEHPDLTADNPGKRIPHTYKTGDICVFRADFRRDQKLATTVVPWLLHWIVFYESWRVTGEWQGGGVHPSDTSIRRSRCEKRRQRTRPPLP
jgi:hypothetical protein